MKTETKITLYLNESEYYSLHSALQTLKAIDNLFGLDSLMREKVSQASNSIYYILDNCEEEDNN